MYTRGYTGHISDQNQGFLKTVFVQLVTKFQKSPSNSFRDEAYGQTHITSPLCIYLMQTEYKIYKCFLLSLQSGPLSVVQVHWKLPSVLMQRADG
jgi:hypothetical protein